MSTIKFPGNTISLSDTIDQYARKLHINVRNGKATMVFRWKDRVSDKAHTQRMTLNDDQAGRLFATMTLAIGCVVQDETRKVAVDKGIDLAARDIEKRIKK